MTSKVIGSSGIEFPDSTVQSSAAYTKADMNNQCFRAYSTAPVSVPNATPTQVFYQTELFDPSGVYDAGVSEFRPNVAGYYFVTASASFGAVIPGADTFAKLTIRKNSVDEIISGSIYLGSVANTAVANGLVYMNGTTDYLTVEAYQSANVTIDLAIGQPAAQFFSAFLARRT